jgi:hypothetical protein
MEFGMKHIPLLFGRFLVKAGWVTEAQVQRAIQLQKELTPNIGEVALLESLLTVDDLRRVLAHQRRTGLFFREAVCQLGLLDSEQLASLEERGRAYRIPLGEVMILQGSITAAELEEALQAFRRYQASGVLEPRSPSEAPHLQEVGSQWRGDGQ